MVIDLQTIATAIVVALLHSKRQKQKVTETFLLLPLRLRKSDNYCYHKSWKVGNFKESNQEKKQVFYTKLSKKIQGGP